MHALLFICDVTVLHRGKLVESAGMHAHGSLCACGRRAKANGAATMGKYQANANGARNMKHTDSLHEKDYKY